MDNAAFAGPTVSRSGAVAAIFGGHRHFIKRLLWIEQMQIGV